MSTNAGAAGTGDVAGEHPPPVLDRQNGDKVIGRACPNCHVEIFFVTEDPQMIGPGIANADGSFSIELRCGFGPGILNAWAIDVQNRRSELSAPLQTLGTSPCETDTPVPTDTPVIPVDTPVSTDTPAPGSTDTPVPTDTPGTGLPTNTPVPTDTPVPGEASPTGVPTPGATGTPEASVQERNVDISLEEDLQQNDSALLIVQVLRLETSVTRPGGVVPVKSLEEVADKTWLVYFGEFGPTTLELQVLAPDYDITYSPSQTQQILQTTDVEWRVALKSLDNPGSVGEQKINVTIIQTLPEGEDLPDSVSPTYFELFEYSIAGEGQSTFSTTMEVLKWALPGGILPFLLVLAGLNRRRITAWYKGIFEK